MIEVIKPKKKGKASQPYYQLIYNYMIGDANGDTSEEVDLSLDNPFIERYCKLLNSLQPTKGTWGLSLSQKDIGKCFDEHQINEDDYKFLMRTMFEEYSEYEDELEITNYFVDDISNDYADEFAEGVRAEAEYSFLVFQGVDLVYVDEFSNKHKTKFI